MPAKRISFIFLLLILTLSSCSKEPFDHKISIQIDGDLRAECRSYQIKKDGSLVGKALKDIHNVSKDIYETGEYILSNKDKRELNNLIELVKKNYSSVREGYSDGGINATVMIDNVKYTSIYFTQYYVEQNVSDESLYYTNRTVLDLIYFTLDKLPIKGKKGVVPGYYLNHLS